MNKLIIILLTVLGLSSCGIPQPKKEEFKTIKIVEISCLNYKNLCEYIASNGETRLYFKDSCNKYKIGDTLTK